METCKRIDNPRCETCRWWVASTDENDASGQCHRYPPTPLRDPPHSGAPDGDDIFAWPETLCISFCGEHTPKDGDERE